MKKLMLTAAIAISALSTVAFATPRQTPKQMDYRAEQWTQPQYTGNVIIAPLEPAQESVSARQARLASYARISPEQAARAAFARAPGNVSHIQLGTDQGVLVYEVVVGNTEVSVNALNGSAWGHTEQFASPSAALAESERGTAE